MVSVVWRSIPTVLTVEELLDKAFSKAKKEVLAELKRDRTLATTLDGVEEMLRGRLDTAV